MEVKVKEKGSLSNFSTSEIPERTWGNSGVEGHSLPSTLLCSQCQHLFWSCEQGLCYPLRLWVSVNDHPTLCFQHLGKHGSVVHLSAGAELRKHSMSKLLPATTYCHLLLHTVWLKACRGSFTPAGPECILPTRGCCLQAAAILIWFCLLIPLEYWQPLAKKTIMSPAPVSPCCWSWAIAAPWSTRKTLLVLFGLVVLWHANCPPFLYSDACW